jgi:hypothetical protein
MLLYIMQQIELINVICVFITFSFSVIKVKVKSAIENRMIEQMGSGSAGVNIFYTLIESQY